MLERKVGVMESEKVKTTIFEEGTRRESGYVRVGERCGNGREGATFFGVVVPQR